MVPSDPGRVQAGHIRGTGRAPAGHFSDDYVCPNTGDVTDASTASSGGFRAHNGDTAPQPDRPQVLDHPAETPAAIRAVLAANAGPEVLARYDTERDSAFVKAREDGDLTVLTATVRRWWFEADTWRDPEAQRAFLARVDGYAAEGPPPPGERMRWQEFRALPSA